MASISELIFPESSSVEGFTDLNVGYRSKESAHQIVRELLQNSLDAQSDRSESVNVNIDVAFCAKSDIPDIDGFQAAFDASKSAHNRKGDGRKIIDAISKSLDGAKIPVLFCRDDGKGMNSSEMNNLLSVAVSEKDDGLAGSYGLGHLFAFRASDLRYILYASVSKSGDTIVSGEVQLASHKLGEQYRHKVGHYALGIEMEDNVPVRKFSSEVPKLLKSQVEKIRNSATGTGTVVAILGFNNFNLPKSEVSDAVLDCGARNFFTALHEGTMKLKVKMPDKKTETLDQKNIGKRLEAGRDVKRGSAKGHLSGSKAWKAYLALSKGQKIDMPEAYIWYRGLSDKEIGADTTREVVLARKGMTITYGNGIPECGTSKFTENRPFAAVIHAKGKFAALVNEAENPEHLELNHISEMGADGKTLKNGFAKIAKKIQSAVGILDASDDWSPDGFPILMSRPQNTNRLPDTGREKPKPGNKRKKRENGDPDPINGNEADEQPHSPEITDTSQSVKPIETNDGEIYELLFSVSHKEAAPGHIGVWAMLFSGSDSSCQNPIRSKYLDIEEIIIPGEENAIPLKAKEVIIPGSKQGTMRLRLKEPIPAHLGGAVRLSLRQRSKKGEDQNEFSSDI